MKQTIQIDEEFRDLLPMPTAEVLHELEESLVKEGCREPLIVWEHDGKLILLDGHTRKIICDTHGIEYRTAVKTWMDLPDRAAAIEWILRNQLARRNLTPEQFTLYLGRLYERLKNPHFSEKNPKGQFDPSVDGKRETTAETLAKEHGVSVSTVKRAGKNAKAVDKLMADGKSQAEAQAIVKAKAPTAPEKQESLKDADGVTIPDDLRLIFAEAEQFEAFAKKASHLKGEFASAFKANPAAWVHLEPQRVLADVSMLHQRLMESRPYLICPVCGGEDPQRRCRQCGGSRWLSRHAARSVALDLRNPQRELHGLHLLEKASQKAGE